MKKILLLSGLLIGAFAQAQVTVPVNNLTFQGGYFATAFDAAELTGTLTSIDINVTLTATVNDTYANDFTIILGTGLTATDTFPLQAGGFSDIQADERIEWTTGNAGTVGTVCAETADLVTPINFDFSPTLKVYFGNGYFATGASGTWNGSFTLNGVSVLSNKQFDQAAFLVFPNPANSVVNVSSGNAKITHITMTDLNGRVVKEVSFDKMAAVQVNIDELSSGMYLMNIKSDLGQAVRKITKS